MEIKPEYEESCESRDNEAVICRHHLSDRRQRMGEISISGTKEIWNDCGFQ